MKYVNTIDSKLTMDKFELKEMLEEAYMKGFNYGKGRGTVLGSARDCEEQVKAIMWNHEEFRSWFGKMVDELRANDELVSGLSAINRRKLAVLRIADLKDLGTVNTEEAEEFTDYVPWYTEKKGCVTYKFAIRQLKADGTSVVVMERTPEKGERNLTYTLVRIPDAEEYARTASIQDDLFGGIDLDEVFDKFFGQYGIKRRK